MITIFTEPRKRNCEASVCRYELLGALISPNDQWRGPAHAATASRRDVRLVTTEVILIEVLNFFANHGEEARLRAASRLRKF